MGRQAEQYCEDVTTGESALGVGFCLRLGHRFTFSACGLFKVVNGTALRFESVQSGGTEMKQSWTASVLRLLICPCALSDGALG